MKRTLMVFLFVLLVAQCLVYVNPTSGDSSVTSPKTIVVPDNFIDIQEAIDNANAGDTVYVRSGTYNQSIKIDKSICLIGQDSKTTVLTVPTIYGHDYVYTWVPPSPVIAITVNADNVKISSFTIKNDNLFGVGINSNGTGNLITDVSMNSIGGGIIVQGSHQIVCQNYIANGNGIRCGGSYNQIIGNQLIDDTLGFSLSGQFNTVAENHVVGGSIYLGDSSLIYNNSIIGCGIYLWNSNSNIIYKNALEESILTLGGSAGSASNNLIAANTIERGSAVAWAILVGRGSNNTFYGNLIANNGGYGLAIGGIDIQVDNNLFYYNMFENNSKNFGTNWQVIGSNSFDNGSVGNYWDDYSGNGNTPYFIYCNTWDNHPLMVPFDISSVSIPLPSWLSVANLQAMLMQDTITVLAFQESTQHYSLVNLSLKGNISSSQMSNVKLITYQAKEINLSFTLTGQSGTLGFCNITVPKNAVLSELRPTVYIDNQIASNQGYMQDDANYYVWYTTEFSTHEVSIIFQLKQQVPVYILIVLSFFVLILISAILFFYKRKGRSKAP